MKRLVTTDLGGFPFVLDDLRFIESGVIEAFKGAVSPFVGNLSQLILSGCSKEIVGANIVVEEGFFYHQGEIYFVPAETIPNESKIHQYFDVNIAYDPDGEKEFQSGPPAYQTYQIRTMKLVQSDSLPSGFITYSDLDTLHHRGFLAQGFQDAVDWTDLPDTSYTYPAPEGRTQFSRDVNGYIHFRGHWNNDDPDSSMIIGTLPVGFRPELDIRFNYTSGYFYDPTLGRTYEILISASTGVIDVVGPYFPQFFHCISFPSFKAV